ncbi:MAG: CehA/McbA family metallohydrolase [Clostridiales bacterium]|nr:CehA/McbA family metallohydrolase [Clostridiales bacterium]
MNGQPVIAEIQLHGGKEYSPYRYSTIRTYPTDRDGKFNFDVPASYDGFRLIVVKGGEYEYVEIPFDVKSGYNTTINVKIARIIDDLTLRGWYAGDGHQHSTRSDGRDPVEQVALQNIASGNAWGMLSDHRHLNGVPEFIQRTSNYPVDFAGNDGHFLPVQGYEWTSGQPSGHMNVFGPGSEKLLSSDFPGLTGEARHAEHARRILEFQGAGSFVQANHPTNPTLKFMHESDGSVDYMRAWFVDAIEVWNSGDGTISPDPWVIHEPQAYGTAAFTAWVSLLNRGGRTPATATTDSHTLDVTKIDVGGMTMAEMANFLSMAVLADGTLNSIVYDYGWFDQLWGLFGTAMTYNQIPPQLRNIFGEALLSELAGKTKDQAKEIIRSAFGTEIAPRMKVQLGFSQSGLNSGDTKTYAHIPEGITEAGLLDALRTGQSFLTNGPLLFTEINGQEPDNRYGHEAVLNADGIGVLNIDLTSNRTIDNIYIIADGELIQKIPVDSKSYQDSITLDLTGKHWVFVDAWGERYARALTNPIFLTTPETSGDKAAKADLFTLIKSAMAENPDVALAKVKTDLPEGIIALSAAIDDGTRVLFDMHSTVEEVQTAIAAILSTVPDSAAAKLVIGFVYFGTDNASAGTHSFVEIYNPNDFAVTLTDAYSLQYKSMDLENTPDWLKLDLVGEIPAKHSFLVNMGASGAIPGGANDQIGRLDLTSVVFDQDFTIAFSKLHNKGIKVVLMANQEQLPSSLKNPFDGDGAGQAPGYVDMYGVSGNDNDPAQQVDGFENECVAFGAGEAQSKQKGFVRINKDSGVKYEDTDNNLQDFQMVDFRTSDLDDALRIPRSLADGAFVQGGGQEPDPVFVAEALTLSPGATSQDVNFTWYSESDDAEASQVQVARKSAMAGKEFPVDAAIIVEGTVGAAAPGKAWHKASVTGLDNDTLYIYRVSNDKNIYSEIYEWRTGPETGFSFIAIGDAQLTTGMQDTQSVWPDPFTTTEEGWANTVDTFVTAFPEASFILSAGDQVDASGGNEAEYANLFAPDALRGMPLAPAMGNHDRHNNFDWHYNLPNVTPNGTGASLNGVDAFGNYWYRYNDALFVVLNTSASPTSAAAAAPYIAQFDATLTAAKEANPDVTWLFVQHHKSTAAPASHQTDADVRVWTPLVNELMDRHGVDFVIAGHDHVYSRSWHILDNAKVEGIDYAADSVTDPEGTLYLSLNTSSGLKYYDYPTNTSGNPAWVDDTSNMRYEGKNSITFNGKPWYTNVAVQVKAPQFTVVDVEAGSVTFTTYRVDDLSDILDQYSVIKTGDTPAPPFDAETLTLTPGMTAGEMGFTWYSSREDNGASLVQVAKKADMEDAFPLSGAISVDGTRGDATDGKSWHKAGVSGLEPDTAYVYRVSNDGVNFSVVYEFKTGSGIAFSFAVIGDPQLTTGNQDSTSNYRPDGVVGTTKQGWQDTLEAVAEKGVDFIAGVGDQVDLSLTTNEAEYANFFAPSQMQSTPFAPAVGNHDRNDGFAYHYNLPNELSFETLTGPAYGNPSDQQAAAEARGNYFYTYNNALFVVLNTSSYPTSTEAAAAVVARFDETLRTATQRHAGEYDWLFVQHHKSTASVADHLADRDIQYYVEAGFERLMDQYGVDFVLAGHDHVYARSYPMLGGVPDKTGASGEPNVTLVTGGDGATSAINPKGTVYFTTTTGSGLKYYELFNNAGNLYVKDNIFYPYLVDGLVGSAAYMDWNLPLSAAKYLQNKTPGFIVVNVAGNEVSFAYYDLSSDYLETPYDVYTVTKTDETGLTDMTAYNKAFDDFCAYYNTATWAFRKDMFTNYTDESVAAAEGIMGAGGKDHADLLAAYGKLAAGRFDETDSEETVALGTSILNGAIADMFFALVEKKIPVTYTVTFLNFFAGVAEVVTVEENAQIELPTDFSNTIKWGLEWIKPDRDFSGNWLAYIAGVWTPLEGVSDNMLTVTSNLMIMPEAIAVKAPVTLVGVTASAYVTKLSGNKNDLTIEVIEMYSDGTLATITETFSINNNASGTYSLDSHRVYVDTKGNDQIRECRIV